MNEDLWGYTVGSNVCDHLPIDLKGKLEQIQIIFVFVCNDELKGLHCQAKCSDEGHYIPFLALPADKQ